MSFLLYQATQSLHQRLFSKMNTITREEIQSYTAGYLQQFIQNLHNYLDQQDETTFCYHGEALENYQNFQDNALLKSHPLEVEGFSSEENQIKLIYDYFVQTYQPKDLTFQSKRIFLNAIKELIDELENLSGQMFSFSPELKPKYERFNSVVSEIGVSGNTVSFNTAYNEFLDECYGESVTTTNQRIVAKKLWLECFGDHVSITSINERNARRYKQILNSLPKNREKSKKYKEVPLDRLESMNIPERDRLKAPTKNSYLSQLSSFVKWLRDNYSEFDITNPFLNMRVKDKEKKKEKRHSFSSDQIKTLLNSMIYRGSRGCAGQRRYQEGDKIVKDSMYWVPLIAIFTGARMEEILRFRKQDILEEDGIHYFSVNEDDGVRRKTTNALRRIPIHQSLIDLGILDFIEEHKGKRPFCDTPISKHGKYSKVYSQKFGRLLDRLNIKTEKTCFHSTRHSFIDRLRLAGVSEDIRTELVGHESSNKTHNGYGDHGTPLSILKEAVDKICYDGVSVEDGMIVVS
tara:strand:- start:311 stop:1864 length:1554 start_codon:yes stop_codon:yes gene_type:complete